MKLSPAAFRQLLEIDSAGILCVDSGNVWRYAAVTEKGMEFIAKHGGADK